MTFLQFFFRFFISLLHGWRPTIARLLVLVLGLSCVLMGAAPAWAGLNDDHYDGNIFALYAGNGSLFPPRVTLAESLQRDKPVVLAFFIDDSRDCKLYASVLSQIDAFYGRAANLIPVNADTILPNSTYSPTEPGYYYKGFVPQTVILDQSGQVVFDEIGNIAYEQADDVLREVFDLLPRSESVELKRRPINEFNTELVN
ncbi:thylakoid membrane photosystem I accumulation factor [Thermocoleostomius sinensis]|uniref:Thylakoid membrane photosystem I accumulation factor n=1 Tax=Thermocoleostomius sinensis A174 TaxID=2016057 RepID=A0A9E9CAT7_9CYAN|nr:thylakoid membrane photosystem I accumulation factor [Thermocoleostomius sinensis A174]